MTDEIQETITEIRKCEKCGGKVERRVAREKQQKGKSWYVETCTKCDY